MLKVAACQILTYSDIKQSVKKMISWLEKAKEAKVDLLLFPEMTLCGYVCDKAYWRQALPKDFIIAERQLIKVAKRLDIAVVFGTAHWDKKGVYNDLLIIDKGGKVRGRYSKTHLAESFPLPGRTLPIYTLCEVKCCFIICHDVRYPELVRLPAVRGAQICLFASNESGLVAEHKLSAYRAMPIARAAENEIFLIMANAPANADGIKSTSQSHGNSKIIHPNGNVLIEAGYFEEKLIIEDISPDDAKRRIAERSVKDDTILKDWMIEGTKLLSPID